MEQPLIEHHDNPSHIQLQLSKAVFPRYREHHKCMNEEERDQTIGVYEVSYFKDIFLEEKLNKYLRELEKIWNKKE